jgi:hypothetical protein
VVSPSVGGVVNSSIEKSRAIFGIESGSENAGANSGSEGGNSGTETAEVNSSTEKDGAAGIEEQGVAITSGGEAAEPSAAPPPASEAQEDPPAPEAILPLVEAPPTAPSPKSRLDLSPVDYLLSVMNDAQAPPGLRIKAARVTAPYVHARVGQAAPDEAAIDDPYGFTFDLAVAKALREDVIALQKIPSGSEDERRAVEKRIFERQMTFPEPPPSYTRDDFDWDRKRLEEVEKAKAERLGSKQVKKVKAEALILTVRTKAFKASFQRPQIIRLGELMDKKNRVDLTFDETGELARLFANFPHLERPQFIDEYNDSVFAAARRYHLRTEEDDKRDAEKKRSYQENLRLKYLRLKSLRL